MAKPKDSKASRTIFGTGFLRAPGGNIVAVRGLMDLAACESLSPVRVDADMRTRPTAIEDEPDNMGHVARRTVPMLAKVGEHRVHGQLSSRTGQRAKDALWLLLERAIHGPVESLETLDALVPPPAEPKPRITETKRDKRLRAERAMDLLGKPDVVVARVLKAAGRSEEQIKKYLAERAA